MLRRPFAAVLLLLLLLLAACSSPTYTRGSDDPSIDDAALSTRLDRRDLEQALDQWMVEFDGSNFFRKAEDLPDGQRSLAILSIENQTSEHISGALGSLIRSFETQIINGGVFEVVANDEIAKNALIEERVRSLGETVDPETRAMLGKEFGVNYFVYGYVGDVAEKTQDKKRVQYFLFMTVTSVETGRKEFQYQVDITKQMEG